MKRRICRLVVSAVLVLASPLASADTGNEDPQSLRSQLLVKVHDEMIGSVNTRTGLITASTITTWTPYLGFSRISEEEFFGLAGYDVEADQARAFHSLRTVLLVGGTAGGLLGALGMCVPFIDDFSNWSMDFMWISAAVLTISSVPVIIAIFRPNWATVEIAIRVADDYNERLKANLPDVR